MWNRRTDDELISAWLDGRLEEPTRKSFETRLGVDPALRQRVEATRQLVEAARSMTPVPAPRNFTLPATATGARTPAGMPSRLGWRLGTAIATLIFVMAVGMDLRTVLQQPQAIQVQSAPAPTEQKEFAIAPTEAPSIADNRAVPSPSEEEATAPALSLAAPAAQAPVASSIESTTLGAGQATATAAPNLRAAAAVTLSKSAPTVTLSPEATSQLPPTPAPAATLAPTQVIESRPQPVIPTAAPELFGTPWSVIAIVALALAVICGVLGWRPR